MWVVDGSLRDIYVSGATQVTWGAFLELARSYGAKLLSQGRPADFPAVQDGLADLGHNHLLVVSLGQVRLHCHFFSPDEIELDVDPRDVTSEDDHLAVLKFVRSLSISCKLAAVITPENLKDRPYLRFEPENNQWFVL